MCFLKQKKLDAIARTNIIVTFTLDLRLQCYVPTTFYVRCLERFAILMVVYTHVLQYVGIEYYYYVVPATNFLTSFLSVWQPAFSTGDISLAIHDTLLLVGIYVAKSPERQFLSRFSPGYTRTREPACLYSKGSDNTLLKFMLCILS